MNIVNWLVTSSADPKKTSMTILSAALAAIPIIMHVLSLTCGLNVVCVDVTGDELKTVAETFANFVFFALSAVSAAGVVIGLLRKLSYGRWSAA